MKIPEFVKFHKLSKSISLLGEYSEFNYKELTRLNNDLSENIVECSKFIEHKIFSYINSVEIEDMGQYKV